MAGATDAAGAEAEAEMESQMQQAAAEASPAEDARPDAGAEGSTVMATSLQAYSAKCRVILAPAKRHLAEAGLGAGPDDGDDDDVLAPGVSQAFGGLGGGPDKACYQGRNCKKKNCKWLHPYGRLIDALEDGAGSVASLPAAKAGPNLLSGGKGQKGLKGKVLSSGGKAADDPKAAAAGPKAESWHLPTQTTADAPKSKAAGAPKSKAAGAAKAKKVGPVVVAAATEALTRGRAATEEAECEDANIADSEAAPEGTEGQGAAEADGQPKAKKRKVAEGEAAEGAAGADVIDVKAAMEADEEEQLKKEKKRLETKLEIAELRAENAELKLKSLETKFVELEELERDLSAKAAKDSWQPDRPRSTPGAQKGGSAGGASKGKSKGKGGGKGGGKASNDGDDNVCWNFRKGNCKMGAKCKWSHS